MLWLKACSATSAMACEFFIHFQLFLECLELQGEGRKAKEKKKKSFILGKQSLEKYLTAGWELSLLMDIYLGRKKNQTIIYHIKPVHILVKWYKYMSK